MSDNGDPASSGPKPGPTPHDVYEEMTVLEPYTTGELAARYAVTKRRIVALLDRLFEQGSVRKKQLDSDQTIWIRDPPIHECPECGYTFEIQFLHPVLSSVQFCPQCGTQL